MNSLIAFFIKHAASLLLGSDVFLRIVASVERWADREISGAEKKESVLGELEVLGLKLTKSLANFGVEAALQYLRTKS